MTEAMSRKDNIKGTACTATVDECTMSVAVGLPCNN